MASSMSVVHFAAVGSSSRCSVAWVRPWLFCVFAPLAGTSGEEGICFCAVRVYMFASPRRCKEDHGFGSQLEKTVSSSLCVQNEDMKQFSLCLPRTLASRRFPTSRPMPRRTKKQQENKAKANPKLAEVKKETNHACRERRKESGSSKSFS